jgi:hypothetical protein
MSIRTHLLAAIFALGGLLHAASAMAETRCGEHAGSGSGVVMDATGAVILGATVRVGGVVGPVVTGRDGRFETACLAEAKYSVTIEAQGFSPVTRTLVVGPGAQPLAVRLKPMTVTTEVTTSADAGGVDSQDIAGSRTMDKNDIGQLADDPDEFSRQLQVLAAAAGGAPGQAIVTVDGFQNSGQIPPKSAISFIRVNPDLFSAEYARPPYRGGRIEIYTKPGQSALHGALFTTQSAGFLNAKDPFSPARAAIEKQRYGFELSGPLVKNRSDFALALEHREIDQFAVVDAVTLDASGNQVSVSENVAAAQSLWEGSARFGFLPTPNNNLTVTYTANVNGLTNQGVGGTVLVEAGYGSVQSKHTVQAANLMTLSPALLHETRFGYTWNYEADTPNSVAPSLQVAGAFTGGGVTTGAQRNHERDLEFDDDFLYSHGKHNVKAGIELLDTSLHNTATSGFNGTYIFGGGNAPALDGSGTSIAITGLEQYRRALLGLPGGMPTQFNVTTGTAAVSLNQLQAVLYAQDQWKFRPRLQFALGLRWAMQNAPVTVGNTGPRLGVSWAPDRKQKTVFHARSGIFFGTVDPATAFAAHELNGTIQRIVQINDPVYGSPLTTGTSSVTTVRAPLPGLTQTPSLQSHVGVEHDFPRHWHVQGNLYLVHAWDVLRSRNINSPLDDSPSGPRPIAPDVNLFQFQQTGRLSGNVIFAGVDQHSLKRLQIFAGYVRMDLRGDADVATAFPESSSSDSGEVARPSWEATHQVIAFTNYVLPRAVNLSFQFNAASGMPYNITTGFDNNGDGVFNDRPVFAAGQSGDAEVPVYETRFGLLSPEGPGTSIGRDAGTLPWNVHLDANLSRNFVLPHRAGKAGSSLNVNLRSTNLLNHNNVLAVGGVLGSPLFGQAYQSDPGRRIEVGLRYSF